MIVNVSDSILEDDIDKVRETVFTICRLLEQRHFVKLSGDLMQVLPKIVEDNVPPHLYNIFQSARNYINPSSNKCKFLRTVNLDDTDEQTRRILFFKPSELLLENAPYEWSVYKTMIDVFVDDDNYGDIFDYIRRMVEIHNLVPSHAGGIQTMPAIVKMKSKGDYRGLYKMKCCTIMDRDADCGTRLSEDNRNVLKFYSGKEFNEITNDDIYKLDFEHGYIWHVLYKREIENYFPIEEYEKLNVNMDEAKNCADYDYFKFETGTKEGSYRKSYMQTIGKSISYPEFTKQLHSFKVGNKDYNEMQLLLLKIAKIV